MRAWLLLAFLAVPSHATESLSSLISDARILALDTSGTRQRFSDSQITEFINMGQRQASAATHCLYSSQGFTLAVGTTYYALPSNFLAMKRVLIGSKMIFEKSPEALDAYSRQWETATGYPQYYFINFSSPTMVGFYPFPGTSSDTDTIKMDYYIYPPDLSANTDIPYNSLNKLSDYDHALAYFAAAMMQQIDGVPQAQGNMSLFQAMIAQMTTRCVERPAYSPSLTGSP